MKRRNINDYLLTQDPQRLRLPGLRRRSWVRNRPRRVLRAQAARHTAVFLGVRRNPRAPVSRGKRGVRDRRSDHHIEERPLLPVEKPTL